MDLSSQQAVAVLGIGLIAMGDEVGSQVREGERGGEGEGMEYCRWLFECSVI